MTKHWAIITWILASAWTWSALAVQEVEAGPAVAVLEYDRYSGIGSFELTYDGYLHNCDDPSYGSAIEVHLIFRTEAQTKVFVRSMHRLCGEMDFLGTDVAYFRSLQYQQSEDHDLWHYLTQASHGYVRLEVAFTKDGYWDSDYGHNFPVHF